MNNEKIIEISFTSKKEQWPYPKTFQALKDAGVTSYEVIPSSRQITYFIGNDSFQEPIPAGFQPHPLGKIYKIKAIMQAIKDAQLHTITYEGFLKQIANAGVALYRVEMESNVITYLGANSGEEYAEIIPKSERMD
jgi:uncharacterized protein YbcV (DUF1398 family)